MRARAVSRSDRVGRRQQPGAVTSSRRTRSSASDRGLAAWPSARGRPLSRAVSSTGQRSPQARRSPGRAAGGAGVGTSAASTICANRSISSSKMGAHPVQPGRPAPLATVTQRAGPEQRGEQPLRDRAAVGAAASAAGAVTSRPIMSTVASDPRRGTPIRAIDRLVTFSALTSVQHVVLPGADGPGRARGQVGADRAAPAPAAACSGLAAARPRPRRRAGLGVQAEDQPASARTPTRLPVLVVAGRPARSSRERPAG